MNAASRLAKVVRKLGRIEEAIELHKEVIRVRVNVLGPANSMIKKSCELLSKCYEDQGFYEDAVELYREFVEKLRDEEVDQCLEIMKYESWIEWNRERVQERDRWTREEEDKTGEHYTMEKDDESQEEGRNDEDDYHSRAGVEEVEEGEDVETEAMVGVEEGVCLEGKKPSEEDVWSFVTL